MTAATAITAMLPMESNARAALGDRRCGAIMMELDLSDECPESWGYLSGLAAFETGGYDDGEQEIATLLVWLDSQPRWE